MGDPGAFRPTVRTVEPGAKLPTLMTPPDQVTDWHCWEHAVAFSMVKETVMLPMLTLAPEKVVDPLLKIETVR